jgi:hypothetical protein
LPTWILAIFSEKGLAWGLALLFIGMVMGWVPDTPLLAIRDDVKELTLHMQRVRREHKQIRSVVRQMCDHLGKTPLEVSECKRLLEKEDESH